MPERDIPRGLAEQQPFGGGLNRPELHPPEPGQDTIAPEALLSGQPAILEQEQPGEPFIPQRPSSAGPVSLFGTGTGEWGINPSPEASETIMELTSRAAHATKGLASAMSATVKEAAGKMRHRRPRT